MNAQYVLFDNAAELHAPKDLNRHEIAMEESLIAALRVRVLQDVYQMSEKGLPLSAHWWRQLGREDLALEVEAGRITQKQRERALIAASRAAALEATREPTWETY